MEALFEIQNATTPADIDRIRELFFEYGRSLAFHICFQTFEQEMAALPGAYGPPAGFLLLASVTATPAGCVALRQLSPGIGEMKRLYVRPEFRGSGLGRRLTEQLLRLAADAQYTSVRLDTLPHEMPQAVALYRSLGFREITPYYTDPIPGAMCMEINLRQFHSHSTGNAGAR